MKSFKTLRLFYNKYPFKVVVGSPRNSHLQSENFLRVSDFKEKFPNTKMRREWHSVSFFSLDIETHNSFKKEFDKEIIEVYEPDEEQLKQLTGEKRIEIRRKLTHGCRYRVKLGKMERDANFDSFLNLVRKHPDEFVIPGCLQDFFDRRHKFFYGVPYFFVKSDKFLTMAQLVYPGQIKEVTTIMTPDEIEEQKACPTT